MGNAAVQRLASEAGAKEPAAVHEAAARGVSGAGGALPFSDRIQAAFGPHDVSGVKAHVGGEAASASAEMGASAFATGNDVAFAGAPDLHTAAHEAAHVVQQEAGVQLMGGVGRAGDAYEENADAVADRVVNGQDASELLDAFAGGGAAAAVQRSEEGVAPADPILDRIQKNGQPPVYLARCANPNDQAVEGGAPPTVWVLASGASLDGPGTIEELLTDTQGAAAVEVHTREWGAAPPDFTFLSGGMVGRAEDAEQGADSGGAGGAVELTSEEKQFLYAQLAQRTALAVDSFRAAGEHHAEALKSAAKASGALGAVLFDMIMVFAAPGVGNAIRAIAGNAAWKLLDHADTLGEERVLSVAGMIEDVAGKSKEFVASGTKWGKHELKSSLYDASLLENQTSFINQTVQGFRASCQAIMDNAGALSDGELLAKVGQFDVNVATDAFYRTQMAELVRTFERSVEDIAGPHRAAINIFDINQMTSAPKFLANVDGTWWVIQGSRLDAPGALYEEVPGELVEDAKAAHEAEWEDMGFGPPPNFRALEGGRAGP